MPGSKKNKPFSKAPLSNLDVRNAVGVYRLAKYLKVICGATEIYHVGIGAGKGPSTDCHNQGRAVDFVGVKETIDGKPYIITVFDDWANKSVPNENDPTKPRLPNWPLGTRPLSFRLDPLPSGGDPLARDFFSDLYHFITAQYQDKTDTATQSDPPSRIGEGSFVMHPDHPTSAPGTSHGREAHRAHIHMQIGKT